MEPADRTGPAPRPTWESWADACILGVTSAFLGAQLRPDLLLLPTTPSGGDIPSHYATLVYLKEQLLPQGRISGWAPGNYAGFPALQFYFPLSFLLMAALSAVVALPVAFKLVTMLGTMLLPTASYALVRLMGWRFPSPALAALATLLFCFQEGNSMWGGNIMSTLAGEFAFSLGMALAVFFLGAAWAGVMSGRGLVGNAALLALVGLGHGYTLLFAGLTALALAALGRDRLAALRYLLAVYGLAFCLLGAWILPLLANLPYTTAFAPAWFIKEWTEVLPRDFWAPAAAALAWSLWLLLRRSYGGAPIDRSVLYLWYGILMSAAGYFLGPRLGVVDVRFLPFGQLLLTILGAIGVGEAARRVRGGGAAAVLAVAALAWWSVDQAKQLPAWIAWNYAGAEQKALWPAFLAVNRALRGTADDPRVVYEHAMVHNGAGSPRMFETLPLYSGRSTLEGLYLQASPNAPAVFYIQAELSREASCPFSHLACTRFNLDDAFRHLRLFNVRDIVAVSDQLKEALRKRDNVEKVMEAPPYEVYRIREADVPGYVTPVRYEPVFVKTTRWKDVAYRWFRLTDQLDVPIVFQADRSPAELDRFASVAPDRIGSLPRRPIVLPPAGQVRTRLTADGIEFDTPYPGHPHLIRVSYHRNWRVEGADGIFLTAPAFMLVYPQHRHVRLTYGPSWPERAGAGLSLAAFAAAGGLLWRARRRPTMPPRLAGPVLRRLGTAAGPVAAGLPILFLVVGLALGRIEPSPHALLNEGIQARDRGDFAAAADRLRRAMASAPASGAAEQAAYYLGTLPYLQGDMEGTIRAFEAMVHAYPTSPFVPEGYYHIGVAWQRLNRRPEARSALELVRDRFAESAWATYAQERLAELDATADTAEGDGTGLRGESTGSGSRPLS